MTFLAASLVTLAALVVIVAIGLSRAHLKSIERVSAGQTRELAISMKRLPAESRLSELAKRAPPGSFAARLVEDLRGVESDATRAAVVNDLLAEIQISLEATASWPRTSARIAVYGCFVLGAIALSTGVDRPIVASIVGLGLVGTSVCIGFGRRADALAHETRAAVDALVEAVVGRELIAPAGSRGAKNPSRRRVS